MILGMRRSIFGVKIKETGGGNRVRRSVQTARKETGIAGTPADFGEPERKKKWHFYMWTFFRMFWE